MGMPSDNICQKKREKQSMKKITCEKLTFPRILKSSTVKFRSATKCRQKLLIGKKDYVTVVDLSATWWQSFALNRSFRYSDIDLHKNIIIG
jgi:hypothetical protein